MPGALRPGRAVVLVALVLGVLMATAGTASAAPAIAGIPDCKDAPAAQMPGQGVASFLDRPPQHPPAPGDPFAKHPSTSIYAQYGYAGLAWHTYDLGCGGAVRDMGAATDTTVGNWLLSLATWGIAATNGVHNTIAHPSQYMAPLDDVVATVNHRVHDAVWKPWGAAALLGVVALLLLYSSRGRLPDVAKAAAWAVLVITVLAGVAQYPTRVSQFFDQAVTSSIGQVNAATAGLGYVPTSDDPARAQGALLVDDILYDAWLRGELGSSTSSAAKKWGPQLFRASAYTWREALRAQASPETAKKLADQKAQAWKDAAQQIQDSDPSAYAALQGKQENRTGTGLLTLLGAMFTSLFRLVADLFTFAGLVMLRFLVMVFPAVAVVGVLQPLSSLVRRVGNIVGACVVNVIGFSAGSAVHTAVISAALSQAGPDGMSLLILVLCAVLTLVAFVLLFPLLSLTSIVGLGVSHRGSSTLQRAGRLAMRYAVTRQAVHDGTEDLAEEKEEKDARPEPEIPPSRDDRGPWRLYRMTNLPPERFSRAEPESPIATGDPMPIEAPRRPAAAVTAGFGSDTAGREPQNKSELEEASAAHEATRSSARREPSSGSEPLTGQLVEEVPRGAKFLHAERIHDGQTEIRPDGIGPRLYDPETKSTIPFHELETGHQRVER